MRIPIIIFPFRILRRFFGPGLDDRQRKFVGILTLFPLIYTLLMLILFALVVPGRPLDQTGWLTILFCGSPFLIMIFSAIVLGFIVMQHPSPTSTTEWLSVHETAQYLGVTESEVMKLIQTGKLQARKTDKQYKIDRAILAIFTGKTPL